MRHRHLDLDPATPITALGRAALDDLLDRGDLGDWTPLLREIRDDPWGEVAGRVLGLAADHPMYGTSSLWRGWIAERRAGPRPGAGSSLRRLRVERGLTQQQMAQRLGSTQPEVSMLERRGDVRLSTLRAYVAAAGGRLQMTIHFGEQAVELQ